MFRMGQSSSKKEKSTTSFQSLYGCCLPVTSQNIIPPEKQNGFGNEEWNRIATHYNLQDLAKVERFIRGDIREDIYRTLLSCKPKKKLSIFVSSTFTDTYRERSILHEEILPELQKRAARDDIQVLFYDMRFGVKDDSSIDHTIWKTCQNAIIQCQSESDGLFFLSLQGDKYGYRALPKLIDSELFETTVKQSSLSEELKAMSRAWYQLNTNYHPPKYELKDLRSQHDSTYWNVVLPTLRDQLFYGIPFDPATPALLINRSMTEWETTFATLYLSSTHKSQWIKRELDFPSLVALQRTSMKKAFEFSDSFEDASIQSHLQDLQQFLSAHCELIRPVPLERLSVQDYIQVEARPGIEYFQKWKIAVTNHLLTEVDNCIALSEVWQLWLKKQFSLSLELMEDILHHHCLAAKKTKHFLGREQLVQEAIQRILQASTLQKQRVQDPHKQQYAAITFAIIGSSGVGKTSLLSKVAATLPTAVQAETLPPIILRFCGTSRFSLHGLHLMQSISAQILCIYQATTELQALQQRLPSQKYEEALVDFMQILKQYPIVLFIDSLDALSNRDEARSKLSFLRNITLHPQSLLIVSTLPDEYDASNQKWIYRYYCEQLLRDAQIPLLEMTDYAMDQTAIETTIQQLLSKRHRSLTSEQYSIVLTASQAEPTMLYLNLCLEVITKWRSWESDVELRPRVKGIIHQIFDDLERQYGLALIRYSFAMITYAREGMSDQELKDCLSQIPAVFAEVTQYWQDIQTVPLHVWLRIKLMIQSLLAEKESACCQWYHRQLQETAVERYQDIQRHCHQVLGRYFTSQSLLLNHDPSITTIWQPQSKINPRRIKEGYYHLLASKSYEEAIEEMCRLEMIGGIALANDGYPFVSALSTLVLATQSLPTFPANLKQRLEHYYRWIRRDMSFIMKNPRLWIPATASAEPLTSLVRQETQAFGVVNATTPGSFLPTEIVWMSNTLNGMSDYNSLLMNLTGHTQTVRSVAWQPQVSYLASASWDQLIKIWDATTGEMLCTLEGHTERVTAISWSPDGERVVSGSWDQQLRVWDPLTGELLLTIGDKPSTHDHDQKEEKEASGEKVEQNKILLDRIETVSWSYDGKTIASGGWDCKISLWDVSKIRTTKAELWKALIGHEAYITDLQWHPSDCNRIASASFDKTIRIWETSTGITIFCLTGHQQGIESISWNRTGDQIVSGSGDNTIKLWKTTTGELMSSWEFGANGLVTSVAWTTSFNSNGTDKKEEEKEEEAEDFIVSGHSDGSIKLWDVLSGTLRMVLEGHRYGVEVVALHPRQRLLASGSFDKLIKIWDITIRDLSEAESHQTIISRNFSRDKSHKTNQATTRNSNNNSNGSEDYGGHEQRVECVAWNSSGTYLASASSDTTIKVWDSNTAEVQVTLRGHHKEVTSVAWHPTDLQRIVSASNDKTIKIWNLVTATLLLTLEGHENFVTAVAWNRSGDRLVSGSYDSTVRIWSSESGKCLETWQGHGDRVMTVAWSPDDLKIATGSGDHTVKIWAVENISNNRNNINNKPAVVSSFVGHTDDVTSVAWHPESRLVVSGSLDKTLKIWDVVTKTLIRSFEGHLDRVEAVSWSQDGLRLASGSGDRTVKIWDAITGELLTTCEGHGQYVTTVAWHPHNHSQLASGSRDTTIKIFISLARTSNTIPSTAKY